jgi:hypothetical protein
VRLFGGIQVVLKFIALDRLTCENALRRGQVQQKGTDAVRSVVKQVIELFDRESSDCTNYLRPHPRHLGHKHPNLRRVIRQRTEDIRCNICSADRRRRRRD